jgi:hypothetical protein
MADRLDYEDVLLAVPGDYTKPRRIPAALAAG